MYFIFSRFSISMKFYPRPVILLYSRNLQFVRLHRFLALGWYGIRYIFSCSQSKKDSTTINYQSSLVEPLFGFWLDAVETNKIFHQWCQTFVLVNEDSLLRTHCCSWCFLGCPILETFVADTKCFWTKSETLNLCPKQIMRTRTNGEI